MHCKPHFRAHGYKAAEHVDALSSLHQGACCFAAVFACPSLVSCARLAFCVKLHDFGSM